MADDWLCNDCGATHPDSVAFCDHEQCYLCDECHRPGEAHDCIEPEVEEHNPFEPSELRAEGEGWWLERDWGTAFYYRGRRLGDRFCAHSAETLIAELLDLARCATEAATALKGNPDA